MTYEERISRVPHLNLTPYLPAVPVGTMVAEALRQRQHIKQFEYSRIVDQAHADYLGETWQGFSLVDITERGDHMIDYYTADLTHPRIIELGGSKDESGFAKFRVTDIGSKMPVSTAYTTALFKDLCRIRVSRLTKQRIIGYHCHLEKALRNPSKIVPDNSYRATIHIPLITNPGCSFSVTKNTGFAGHPDDFRQIDEAEYHQRYGLGEVWMFNSVHYHKATNLGRTDRYHILIYFDFMDPKIRPVIEQALEEYQGPLI